jgi:hypothetical protein
VGLPGRTRFGLKHEFSLVFIKLMFCIVDYLIVS